jgi:hypothetical protein
MMIAPVFAVAPWPDRKMIVAVSGTLIWGPWTVRSTAATMATDGGEVATGIARTMAAAK